MSQKILIGWHYTDVLLLGLLSRFTESLANSKYKYIDLIKKKFACSMSNNLFNLFKINFVLTAHFRALTPGLYRP